MDWPQNETFEVSKPLSPCGKTSPHGVCNEFTKLRVRGLGSGVGLEEEEWSTTILHAIEPDFPLLRQAPNLKANLQSATRRQATKAPNLKVRSGRLIRLRTWSGHGRHTFLGVEGLAVHGVQG